MQTAIRCAVMRGGTSKGLYFLKSDLPADFALRDGVLMAAMGSPGGPSILAFNLKALMGVLDWKLPVQQAINLPNLIAMGDFYASEPEKYPPGVVQDLAARGVRLMGGPFGEGSGLTGIEATAAGLRGGADPRREGLAKGY